MMTTRGEAFIAVNFNTKDINPTWDNIPKNHPDFELSCVGIKDNKTEKYIFTCLELSTDGYGDTEKDAFKEMQENVEYFLRMNFNKLQGDDRYINLLDLYRPADFLIEYWKAFYELI